MEIKAKKSLGQNFLQDEQVLQNIANSIKTNENDLIIEIGAGTGALWISSSVQSRIAPPICESLISR